MWLYLQTVGLPVPCCLCKVRQRLNGPAKTYITQHNQPPVRDYRSIRGEGLLLSLSVYVLTVFNTWELLVHRVYLGQVTTKQQGWS